jgi:exopolysaccharide biosynthesis WecB/TagA/CpsF family protein
MTPGSKPLRIAHPTSLEGDQKAKLMPRANNIKTSSDCGDKLEADGAEEVSQTNRGIFGATGPDYSKEDSRPGTTAGRQTDSIDGLRPGINGHPNKTIFQTRRTSRIRLMGIPVDALTEREVVNRIITDWRRGIGGWVVTPNLDQLRILCCRPELREKIAEKATLMLSDGMPLVWASRFQGTPVPERVAGSQLILSLTAAAAKAGASIYFLGGNPGTGEKAAIIMADANPGLKIAGILSPPMGFERDPEAMASISEQILEAKPDLIYSCFGFPKQELLIRELQEHLPGSWFLGLGGSLSMIAGEFRRAPAWMQRTGLEWVCRLAQEPRRLFSRYIIHDTPFALRLFGSAAWGRWTGTAAAARSRLAIELRSETPEFSKRSDEEFLERILKRYATIDRGHKWLRMTALLKQFTWTAALSAGSAAKRLIDIVGSIILLLALSPVLLALALLVKATSYGPSFFMQMRVGEQGRLFKMYKFRSMCADAESLKDGLAGDNEMAGSVTFKIKEDPRRTSIGSFMRRWSLDELPQLWNVLKGDMSLVGPRPPLPEEVERYTLTQRRRLEAIPGLTCIWQVSGRSEIPFERQVELDVDYIDRQSMSLDLKLMFQTIGAVLQRRGAY